MTGCCSSQPAPGTRLPGSAAAPPDAFRDGAQRHLKLDAHAVASSDSETVPGPDSTLKGIMPYVIIVS